GRHPLCLRRCGRKRAGDPSRLRRGRGSNSNHNQCGEKAMFKQICFFRKRPDMTMDEFLDYYENQHSQLSKRMGRAPSLPNAVRYVRRYLTPEKNPVTGKVID